MTRERTQATVALILAALAAIVTSIVPAAQSRVTSGGSGAPLDGTNVFTALNKFTAGLEAYENNHADNANGVVLGLGAGANDISDSVNIGYQAGGGTSPTGPSDVRVGRHAGFEADSGNSVFMGHAAGQYAYDSGQAVWIGYLAGRNPSQNVSYHGFSSVGIGHEALTTGPNNQAATAVGAQSGKLCTDAVGFVGLGYGTAGTSTACRQSVYIGYTAAQNYSRNRTLVIETDDTLAPAAVGALIYGEFDTRLLNFNAGVGYRIRPESVTTTKTPAILESGEVYYTGDVDGQTFTLVDNPTDIGAFWKFVVTQTQTSNSLSIAPPTGETLRDGTSTCSSLTATAIGAVATVMVTGSGSGGHFTVIDKLGSWTCNP